jgi:hypothetical protein
MDILKPEEAIGLIREMKKKKKNKKKELSVNIVDLPFCRQSRDSSVVCWATGWIIGGLIPGRGWEFFSSPPRPDRF